MSTIQKSPPASSPSNARTPNVSFSHREEGNFVVITRTEGGVSEDIAAIDDKGVLEYVDPAARKHHAKVLEYLADEKIPFKPDTIAIKGKDRDEPKNLPKAPRQTIEQGDKTPAYVEWLKKNKPKEYEAKYGIRGPGVIERVVTGTDPVTGRPTKTVERADAIIADRKTHLTEKPDLAVQTDDEDDDNNL